MKILADTNIFIKFCRRLPLPAEIEETFESGSTERLLSVISILELYRLWQRKTIPTDPDIWLEEALCKWTVVPLKIPIARQAVLWAWEHKDPADRIIAATAAVEGVELWHTDRILKECSGFPQRYFRNTQEF